MAFSEDELMAHLEWDNEEMIQPFPEDELEQTMRPELFGCVDTLEMDLETELSNMDPRFTPQSPDEHRSVSPIYKRQKKLDSRLNLISDTSDN